MSNSKNRISSILNCQNIGILPQGIKEFNISHLKINKPINYSNHAPLRLGKEIEKVFSAFVKASSNYKLIQENIQIQDGKTTLGELDFILQQIDSKQLIHLELVYKFYVYDSNQSKNELEKWIGPNRKDSFIEKFEKLKIKQFPFLYHPKTKAHFTNLNINDIEQKLCFIANLFVHYTQQNTIYPEINPKAIVGYWLSFTDFNNKLDSDNLYYLPQKKEWGIHPKNNTVWYSKKQMSEQIKIQHQRQFSPLCWIKKPNLKFEQCFVVWW